ncbi:MAG: GNAT family protein [Phycisphaerales bacterium]
MPPEPNTKPEPWRFPETLPSRFETRRLVVRTYEPEDALAVLLAIRSSRESLLPWLPWAAWDHRTIMEAVATLTRFKSEANAASLAAGRLHVPYGVYDRSSGRILGGTGLHSFRPAIHQVEIGYWLREGERGRGICTEAVGGLLTTIFKPQGDGGWGLRRAEIVCAGGNARSEAVPRRLGLTPQGRKASDRWIDGRGWDDTIEFGVLAEQWDAAAGRVRG